MASRILVLPAPFNPTKQLIFSENCRSADSQFLKFVNFNSLRNIYLLFFTKRSKFAEMVI